MLALRQLQVPGPQQEAEDQDRQEQPEPGVQWVIPVQGIESIEGFQLLGTIFGWEDSESSESSMVF